MATAICVYSYRDAGDSETAHMTRSTHRLTK